MRSHCTVPVCHTEHSRRLTGSGPLNLTVLRREANRSLFPVASCSAGGNVYVAIESNLRSKATVAGDSPERSQQQRLTTAKQVRILQLLLPSQGFSVELLSFYQACKPLLFFSAHPVSHSFWRQAVTHRVRSAVLCLSLHKHPSLSSTEYAIAGFENDFVDIAGDLRLSFQTLALEPQLIQPHSLTIRISPSGHWYLLQSHREQKSKTKPK
ncbi:hypothetical protein FJTKL_05753 [Diaporthe vaccinii]|uniref:Uncharacterized protein n=1 Tax=Diaporthe vaccinii TaxID=105482 RepID=A0ABR4EXS4_9PEZI